MRRISNAEPGCFIVDLKMLILSLEFPELDGLPVLQEVLSVDVVSDLITSSCLLTTGNGKYSYWPVIPNVPSFKNHMRVTKELCVGQLIGLLQFRITHRHPIKGPAKGLKAITWSLAQGTWQTIQNHQTSLQKRQREHEVTLLD
jgi:hypothetical protein